jgi:hypothetical protein
MFEKRSEFEGMKSQNGCCDVTLPHRNVRRLGVNIIFFITIVYSPLRDTGDHKKIIAVISDMVSREIYSAEIYQRGKKVKISL